MEDTWILLTIIFTVLISLLIFEKWKRNKSDNHLSINEKFVINQNNEIHLDEKTVAHAKKSINRMIEFEDKYYQKNKRAS